MKYSHEECARVARWLNTLPLSAEKACELMHPRHEMWVCFIRALCLAEHSKRKGLKKLVTLLDIFYHQKYEVWQGRVQQVYLNVDIDTVLGCLKEYPSQFARSLSATVLWVGTEITIAASKEIIGRVPMHLPFILNNYADPYFTPHGMRSVKVITGDYVEVPKDQWVSLDYNEEQLTQMGTAIEELCLWIVRREFIVYPSPYKTVFIDEQLYHFPLPISDRSTTIHDFDTTLMGVRFPLEGGEIRLLIQWGKDLPAQYLDMDLPYRITFEEGSKVKSDICYYGRLTVTGCQHSGGIHSILNKVGIAECINIDVNILRQKKAKYVAFVCNVYSNGALSSSLVVGRMDSKHKMKVSERMRVAYDPSMVIHWVHITQPLQKGLLFGVLDIKKKEVVWLEVPLQGQVASDLSLSTVKALLNKLNVKTTIGNLLTLEAGAQGLQVVSDKAFVDEVYDKQWITRGNMSAFLF